MTNSITVTCPGKVLILGGYLILQKENKGIVLSTSSRFQCRIKPSTSLVIHFCHFPDRTITNFSDNRALSIISKTVVDHFPQFKMCFELFIDADSDFYSEGMTNGTYASSVSNVSKTGLGSSSAFIVSTVAAICAFNGLTCHEQIEILAQKANIAIQGIGSGFDISCCVHGSQIYRKYFEDQNIRTHIVDKFDLPDRHEMVLASADGHSRTPRMAKKVMQSANGALWKEICNLTNECIKYLCEFENAENVQNISKKILDGYEILGESCGVEIVPKCRKRVLNLLFEVKGLLMCGIPGAGGYDAIYCIYSIKDPSTLAQIQNILTSNSFSILKSVHSNRGLEIETHEDAK